MVKINFSQVKKLRNVSLKQIMLLDKLVKHVGIIVSTSARNVQTFKILD